MALSRENWIQAALLAIAENGTKGVAVEPLATRLGTTKGSFYWHFSNREALLTATLEHWEREMTDALIEQLGTLGDPVERLRKLLVVAMDDEDPVRPVDLALVSAGSDPVVRPYLDRVQQKRLTFLERCFREMKLTPTQSRHRARLAYGAYLGWFELTRSQSGAPPSRRDLIGYQRTVIDLLTRPDH
ncbi:TetR/AcrR family transcriptional regulator [Nocardia sp. NPDC127526]|uniref:TetR/AcrR family transcriptional regulator n=1 Tax=Nocardia sp. NPDC127526 TaxID=3345393 RepID=UPI00363DA3FD